MYALLPWSERQEIFTSAEEMPVSNAAQNTECTREENIELRWVRDLGDNENITKCQVIHAYYDHHLTGERRRCKVDLRFVWFCGLLKEVKIDMKSEGQEIFGGFCSWREGGSPPWTDRACPQ